MKDVRPMSVPYHKHCVCVLHQLLCLINACDFWTLFSGLLLFVSTCVSICVCYLFHLVQSIISNA